MHASQAADLVSGRIVVLTFVQQRYQFKHAAYKSVLQNQQLSRMIDDWSRMRSMQMMTWH